MFKSTIVIYSDFDPSEVELDVLAREATEGAAICTSVAKESVAATDIPQEARTFFGVAGEESS